uniref:Uncharacterized protein n=1 Tax=Karlodinium veneficum TaxID=407301 RepID=A7WQ18_KARVE|nr:unknown [Karlodinium veneficum]
MQNHKNGESNLRLCSLRYSAISQVSIAVWIALVSSLHASVDAEPTSGSDKRHGALGPGSEPMEANKARETVKRMSESLQKEGDPLRKHGRALACSACQYAAKNFQSKVASKIKGKMKDPEKRKLFSNGLTAACSEDVLPEQFAVVEKNGTEMYVDFREAMGSRHGKVSVKHMTPDNRKQVAEGCRHLLQNELKDGLWERIAALPKDARASDIDFKKLICGRKMADVCDDVGSDDDDEEREEL